MENNSYALLGLMPSLNPRQAGGIEPVEAIPHAIASRTEATLSDYEGSSSSSDEDEEMEDVQSGKAKGEEVPRKLAKGEGRIIRDENGKVIKVILGGDHGVEIEEDVREIDRTGQAIEEDDDSDSESDEGKEAAAKPWGEPMAEWSGEESDAEVEDDVPLSGPRTVGQGIPIGAKKSRVGAKTDVVKGSLPFPSPFHRIEHDG